MENERIAVLETKIEDIQTDVTQIRTQVADLHHAANKRTAFVAGVVATVSLIWAMLLAVKSFVWDHFTQSA